MKKVNFKQKPAFTMIELILVIVIMGILAAVLLPKMQGSRLREGADQVVSHIRYTQHLAIQDDRYVPDDANWFKQRWRIRFSKDGNSLMYTIFSDRDEDNKAQESEIAKNPKIREKLLTGNTTKATSELNLEKKYGITSITFDNNCNINADNNDIAFDYMGRPITGDINNYADSVTGVLAKMCTITLTDNSGASLNITVEAESGFAQIVNP